MDENIQVCTVYVDGSVRVYGEVPRNKGLRKFLRALKFASYGKALWFAQEFEEKERLSLQKINRGSL